MDTNKKISILIPCYNEVDNVEPMSEAVVKELIEELPQYDYELVFIDNASIDGTREKLEKICQSNPKIKAIFNVANFGQNSSPFYGVCQTTGDCTISMSCDFQDPVEMIPKMIEKWEEGHRIVSCVKSSSKESGFVYFLRSVYYKLIKSMSNAEFIEHFTGFGLYDKTFVDLCRQLGDNQPFMRGVVGEYGKGFNLCTIEYEQAERAAGKSHNNFYSLYDAAMLSFTTYTKVGLRLCSFSGYIIAIVSFIIGIVYLVMKLTRWQRFNAGTAPLTIGMFFLGGVVLAFMGFMGEYIMNINTRVINRPVVVEEKRINFDENS